MTYRGGSYLLGNMEYVPCVVLRAHLAGPSLQAKPANGLHIVQAPSPYSLRSIASLTFVREACVVIPKRCVGSKVCILQFSIFSCAHLGSSARNLSRRPKWSTYAESKVNGVKSLCVEGLVDCTIQAEDIII